MPGFIMRKPAHGQMRGRPSIAGHRRKDRADASRKTSGKTVGKTAFFYTQRRMRRLTLPIGGKAGYFRPVMPVMRGADHHLRHITLCKMPLCSLALRNMDLCSMAL